MSELALFLVRVGFIAVLWIFIFSMIGVIRADLFGQRVVGKATERSVPQVLSSPVIPTAPSAVVSVVSTGESAPTGQHSSAATRLVITEGPNTGREIPLGGREVHIGRAPNSDLVISDEYTSTQHAKLVLMNDEWLVQDLNSTNGTFLSGQRIGTPAVVKLNTPIRIGKTVFELRA